MSARDNYIKLLPKQPAAQSYREVLTQEANLVAAAQQQQHEGEREGGRETREQRSCQQRTANRRLRLLSSLRVGGGCVIFFFHCSSCHLPLATRAPPPPPPPYFIVAGCMKEKLIKLFQFHFNFTRCTVLGLVFFSLHSYLVTKAFSSDGDDGGGLCRHFSCMKIQLYALPSYTSPSLSTSIYIIGLYTLPVNFGQPFAGALANGNRISQAFAWPENFFH